MEGLKMAGPFSCQFQRVRPPSQFQKAYFQRLQPQKAKPDHPSNKDCFQALKLHEIYPIRCQTCLVPMTLIFHFEVEISNLCLFTIVFWEQTTNILVSQVHKGILPENDSYINSPPQLILDVILDLELMLELRFGGCWDRVNMFCI